MTQSDSIQTIQCIFIGIDYVSIFDLSSKGRKTQLIYNRVLEMRVATSIQPSEQVGIMCVFIVTPPLKSLMHFLEKKHEKSALIVDHTTIDPGFSQKHYQKTGADQEKFKELMNTVFFSLEYPLNKPRNKTSSTTTINSTIDSSSGENKHNKKNKFLLSYAKKRFLKSFGLGKLIRCGSYICSTTFGSDGIIDE
ncbi:hypothetical protein BDA99DRAFT_534580 [Phascolomyces articulosus]|uniref:Uncharacterized protein n=1 Tax=Phascolomyces articulosus TaxID=60185 RepID=A0AAD5KGR3_9FUNG|nr:hypothetical protein BDA99DRAFT_534580 [Phascolomyces articulosus]